MNYGQLNRRITVSIPGTQTPDGMGGFIPGTPTISTLWCSARQLSMGQKLTYGLEASYAAYEFGFNYESAKNITEAATLSYNGRSFVIKSINELDEAHRTIIIIATEQR